MPRLQKQDTTDSLESLVSPRSPLSLISDEDKENDSNAANLNSQPVNSQSSVTSDGNATANQLHQDHQTQLQPPSLRNFYRNPVKVHRAAFQYEVCALSRVRAAYDMDSAPLTELPRGSVVSVEEIWSNRARISTPICGWLSVYSSRGLQLLMPLDAQAAKIGGHIVFKDEYNLITFAEVTGYDHHCGLHAVQLKNVGLQWVSLSDPNLRYIPQQQVSQRQKLKAAAAPKPETFVNKCMSVDYPSMSPSLSPSVFADSASNSKIDKECDRQPQP